MDTSAIAAQLIGEEPGFCVVLRTAFQTFKTTVSFIRLKYQPVNGLFDFGKII